MTQLNKSINEFNFNMFYKLKSETHKSDVMRRKCFNKVCFGITCCCLFRFHLNVQSLLDKSQQQLYLLHYKQNKNVVQTLFSHLMDFALL